jgi:RNA polymerase sigma factor (TIGR02999 family)
MRRILIDRARKKSAHRHGGSHQRTPMHDMLPIAAPCEDLSELLALDDAIDRLAALDPDKATLVKLLHFAGLNLDEAGAALGISRTTAYRWWMFTRAWLKDAINGATGEK